MVWLQNISGGGKYCGRVEKHEILLLKCLMTLMYFNRVHISLLCNVFYKLYGRTLHENLFEARQVVPHKVAIIIKIKTELNPKSTYFMLCFYYFHLLQYPEVG